MSFDTKIKPNYTQASFATQEEIFLDFQGLISECRKPTGVEES